MDFKLENSVNTQIYFKNNYNVELFLKREDAIHPEISGNKFRKLIYNIEAAEAQNKACLLTFGGAFSNHIAAVAATGKHFKFKTIGVIRGEELENQSQLNPTLMLAKRDGMQLKFVSRSDYKLKEQSSFLKQLQDEFGDFYHIPEGGTNALAIKGCEDILKNTDSKFDYICAPVGTGGTISGLINASKLHQQVIGFSALKGTFLQKDIAKFVSQNNWQLNSEFHFGGYAKISTELISFINDFKMDYNIALDPIYTGKMMFGIMQLIEQGVFKKGSKILAIHTGGLQGIAGMNARLKQKGLPLID